MQTGPDFLTGDDSPSASMQFDTKIAVVIRTDLEVWQKRNVASFLTSGIASAFSQCIGEAYEDRSGTRYLSLIGQPILIYREDRRRWRRRARRDQQNERDID
jgi:hypothetical protein